LSNPYIGEIRIFGGSFAPVGWAFCQGQPLPIAENDALFVLIGTTYGGDGQVTFNLPDLQGRVPLHKGTNPNTATSYTIGQTGGQESVTLTVQQIPVHSHALHASTGGGSTTTPETNLPASNNTAKIYLKDAPAAALANTALTPVGGSQPHENRMPILVIDYIISLYGIYPQPT
jgi:microcystin-dependent protein